MRKIYCGVYQIKNSVTGDCYVGSSKDIYKRFSQHRRSLYYGTHSSPPLQHDWDTYEQWCFSFNVLLICSPYDLLFYEQLSIDNLSSQYNVCRTAGFTPGFTHSPETRLKLKQSHLGKTLTEEQKIKIGNALRGITFSEERKKRYRGRKLSDVTKEKIRQANLGNKKKPENILKTKIGSKNTLNKKRIASGKLPMYKKDELDIFNLKLMGMRAKEICDMYDIGIVTVYVIYNRFLRG